MDRRIEKVPVPPSSRVHGIGFDDYADAYRTEVDPANVPDVDAFARAFLRDPPSWMRTLMRARDAAVRLVGLKRAGREGDDGPLALDVGARHGPFRIYEHAADEIVMGEDDRHLDFRVSLLYGRDEGRCTATVTTVVRFHNALGRAYFVPVAPFHRRIVAAMLRRATATA